MNIGPQKLFGLITIGIISSIGIFSAIGLASVAAQKISLFSTHQQAQTLSGQNKIEKVKFGEYTAPKNLTIY